MSYSKIAPKDYAKLRTQPEHIRQEYEQRANKALQEQVEKERKHLQQQYREWISKLMRYNPNDMVCVNCFELSCSCNAKHEPAKLVRETLLDNLKDYLES